MRQLAQALYGTVGVMATLAGLVGVVRPQMILGEAAASGLPSHLAREEGAAFVFIGLVALWALGHAEERRPVHYAFVVFTALFAAIHWAGYFASGEYVQGAFVNTVPLLAFAVTVPRAPHRGQG
jgi:hypothetical protein